MLKLSIKANTGYKNKFISAVINMFVDTGVCHCWGL